MTQLCPECRQPADKPAMIGLQAHGGKAEPCENTFHIGRATDSKAATIAANCPPAVHTALVHYLCSFPGAHTVKRLSDGRVSVMGVTAKCVLSPDEIWAVIWSTLTKTS